MFSKLSFSISFSQLLCLHEHKTLSTVSFSSASDANYDAFPLMSPEKGFEDTCPPPTHTHEHACTPTKTDRQTTLPTTTHTYKIAAVMKEESH